MLGTYFNRVYLIEMMKIKLEKTTKLPKIYEQRSDRATRN